jgi:hypothetical protein
MSQELPRKLLESAQVQVAQLKTKLAKAKEIAARNKEHETKKKELENKKREHLEQNQARRKEVLAGNQRINSLHQSMVDRAQMKFYEGRGGTLTPAQKISILKAVNRILRHVTRVIDSMQISENH